MSENVKLTKERCKHYYTGDGGFGDGCAYCEIERLRAALDEADDLLCCADASENLEGATAEDWESQKEAWRQRNRFGEVSAPEPGPRS